MVKAIWNGTIIAESENTIELEGNQYFPEESLKKEFLEESDTTSTCPWKGHAKYYNVKVGDSMNKDAAWYYPAPNDAAKEIKGHVAFWKGVVIE